MLPLDASNSPIKVFKNVDLPVPFLPRSPILSFLVILTDKSLRILFDDLGYLTVTLKNSATKRELSEEGLNTIGFVD